MAIAHCVSGQLRTLHTSIREVDRLFARSVDLFALLDTNCQPGICFDAQKRIDAWASVVRPRVLRVLSDAQNASGATADVPPDTCNLRISRHYAAAFWHQHMKENMCFQLVQRYERTHRLAYEWYIHSRPDFDFHSVHLNPVWNSRRIYYLGCYVSAVSQRAPLLCDAFWIAHRRYAKLMFQAVHAWNNCRSLSYNLPCHQPNGDAPECLFTSWLVSHNLSRSMWNSSGDLEQLGLLQGAKVNRDSAYVFRRPVDMWSNAAWRDRVRDG